MTNPNDPAHPTKADGFENDKPGLTKREYFAGLAMQGQCAYNGSTGSNGGPGNIAIRSLEIADALLAELNKPVTT